MRLAYSVPAHREYMASGYSSEPILAEAAASLWDSSVVNHLAQYASCGLISKGERGELVARLLLLLAYDAAVARQYQEVCKGDPEYAILMRHTVHIPLRIFIEELFGPNSRAIMASYADVGSTTFGDAFERAYVRFTHFGRAEDASFTSTEGAFRSILRSMAIQCHATQKSIDIVIPIVMEDSALEESVMSGILISVKDRGKRCTKAAAGIDASELSFFAEEQELYGTTSYGRPYIAILMELGVQGGSSSLRLQESPSRKSPRQDNNAGGMIQNPCYFLHAMGCSSDLYKVVANPDTFAALLASRGFIAEHPRRETEAFVRGMKPVWSLNDACTYWTPQTHAGGGEDSTELQSAEQMVVD